MIVFLSFIAVFVVTTTVFVIVGNKIKAHNATHAAANYAQDIQHNRLNSQYDDLVGNINKNNMQLTSYMKKNNENIKTNEHKIKEEKNKLTRKINQMKSENKRDLDSLRNTLKTDIDATNANLASETSSILQKINEAKTELGANSEDDDRRKSRLAHVEEEQALITSRLDTINLVLGDQNSQGGSISSNIDTISDRLNNFNDIRTRVGDLETTLNNMNLATPAPAQPIFGGPTIPALTPTAPAPSPSQDTVADVEANKQFIEINRDNITYLGTVRSQLQELIDNRGTPAQTVSDGTTPVTAGTTEEVSTGVVNALDDSARSSLNNFFNITNFVDAYATSTSDTNFNTWFTNHFPFNTKTKFSNFEEMMEQVDNNTAILENASTLTGNTALTGAISGNSLNVSGDISGGSLNTTGAISGESTLSVAGAISGNSLNTTGAISGESTLSVAGAISGNSLNVAGAISGNSLNVSGDISGESTLSVAGAISGESSLNVAGAISGNSLNTAGDITASGTVRTGGLHIATGSYRADGNPVYIDVYQAITDLQGPQPGGGIDLNAPGGDGFAPAPGDDSEIQTGLNVQYLIDNQFINNVDKTEHPAEGTKEYHFNNTSSLDTTILPTSIIVPDPVSVENPVENPNQFIFKQGENPLADITIPTVPEVTLTPNVNGDKYTLQVINSGSPMTSEIPRKYIQSVTHRVTEEDDVYEFQQVDPEIEMIETVRIDTNRIANTLPDTGILADEMNNRDAYMNGLRIGDLCLKSTTDDVADGTVPKLQICKWQDGGGCTSTCTDIWDYTRAPYPTSTSPSTSPSTSAS